MKKHTVTFFTTRILVVLICLSLPVAALRIATKELVERRGMDNAFFRLVLFDRSVPELIRIQQAGGDSDISGIANPVENAQPKSALHKLSEKYQGSISLIRGKLTGSYQNSIPYREHLIENYNRMQHVAGWNIMPQNRFSLGDGYLARLDDAADIQDRLERFAELQAFLAERNIGLLYVQPPSKNTPEDTWPAQHDYGNENADAFLSGLDVFGAEYLDFRQLAAKRNVPAKELFYKTDHHWTQKTALWATEEIAARLNSSFGFDIDLSLFSPDAYTETLYQNIFLGSHGRAVTLAYTELEDFSLLHPTFSTQINFRIPSTKLDLSGSFEVSYDMNYINPDTDIYSRFCYSVFASGDRPFIRFTNELDTSGKKILVIKTSFANPVVQFLSLGVEQLDLIDLRSYDGSCLSLIENSDYDLVMFIYGTRALEDGSAFFNFK